MSIIICIDPRHETWCVQPCVGCHDDCAPDRLVSVSLLAGLWAPVHLHPAEQVVERCAACELAESGSLNDGTAGESAASMRAVNARWGQA